jgi:iron complex outermembrane receptor protein
MNKQRRNTRTKQLVMSVLKNEDAALCHEDIENRLPEKIDRVTIYRILQGFCDDGKVHKVINEDGKTYYALCRNCTGGIHRDNHPHFHCIACNTITCIEQPVVEQPVPHGYNALSVASYISGYCQKCSGFVKTVCLLALFFTAHVSGSSQTRITVLDRETKVPVACANVYYPDAKTGCITDTLGQFLVSSPIPQALVQISAIGYQTYLNRISLQENRQVIYLQPSEHELQEVVVVDNSSRLQGENVMNVEKLSFKSGNQQGVSLAGKLTAVAGVENLSTGAGIGKPVIRGLSGSRIAVFSQGVRIENQQWGDEHGLGLDEHGYEQVEIIKGPASLLYGSDALGGVLYFVDERYAKANSVEAAVNSEFNSNTLGFGNNGAFKFSKKRLHMNLFGGYVTHADYADGANSRVPNTRFNTGNFKTALGYTGNTFVASLKYAFLNEKYGLTEADESEHASDESFANGRTPVLPYQDLTTHIISSENTFFFNNESKLKIDAGYVFNSRKELEDEHEHAGAEMHEHDSEAALNMNLRTFSYGAKWYSPQWNGCWSLIAGSQGMIQDNANRGEEILIPDAKTLDIGVFAMTSLHYSPKACLQFGFRFDTRHITADVLEKQYSSFNFSTGIFQPLSTALSFRASLSSGFRAPSMYELLSQGVHHGTNRYETGNSSLKTENSYQIDATLNYKTQHVEIFVNPYFNCIRNYIYLQPANERIDNIPVFNYVQADAFLYGGEAGFHLHPHPLDWLHIDSSYGGVFGQDNQHNRLALMPSQKINTTFSASFPSRNVKTRSVLSLRKTSVYLQNRYSFAQNRVAENEAPTPAYSLLNAGLVLELGIMSQELQLDMAVNNLLNETYYDHLSRYKADGIYNMGRNLNIRIRLPLFL